MDAQKLHGTLISYDCQQVTKEINQIVMKELNGYLEYNGLIYKIQSIEQLRDFMNGLGESAKEMTEQELAALCVNPNPGRDVDKEYSDSFGFKVL